MSESVNKRDNTRRLGMLVHRGKGCLSCGTLLHMEKRKYCSIHCRQQLSRALNIRTGLLRALNTRYATFYFTETVIIMDVLPYGSNYIYTFIYPRASDGKPAEDFCKMSYALGTIWWSEKKRTNRRYLASHQVLHRARRNTRVANCVNPLELKVPAVKGTALIRLKMDRSDLESLELNQKIKSAYRKQAKKHHPDLGGNSETFRKIQQAYEDLVHWVENPMFLRRRGFPDKWFYEGEKNRWVQPTPVRSRCDEQSFSVKRSQTMGL